VEEPQVQIPVLPIIMRLYWTCCVWSHPGLATYNSTLVKPRSRSTALLTQLCHTHCSMGPVLCSPALPALDYMSHPGIRTRAPGLSPTTVPSETDTPVLCLPSKMAAPAPAQRH
jgi:hypothetical protein